MPTAIEGFTHVEYLTVFIAIIFGYVGAEYFLGWGAMLRNRKNIKAYWQHFLWTIFSFVLFIQNWWGIWPRTKMINKGLLYFIYSLVPILLFYLISVILFPSFKDNKKIDMKVYFYENTRWLFSLFAVYFMLTIVSSFVYPDVGNVVTQNLSRGFGILLALGAAYFHKHVVLHVIFLILGFATLAQYLIALPT